MLLLFKSLIGCLLAFKIGNVDSLPFVSLDMSNAKFNTGQVEIRVELSSKSSNSPTNGNLSTVQKMQLEAGTAAPMTTTVAETTTATPIDPSQCLLYLPFNDNVNDQSAYQQTVVDSATPIDQTFRARGYGSLNLANIDSINVTSMAGIDLGEEASFCLYFKPNSNSDEGELLSNLDEATGQFTVKILAKAGKLFQIQLRKVDDSVYESDDFSIYESFQNEKTDPTYPTRFNMICVVYDGATVEIWQNRHFVRFDAFPGSLAISNAPFRIGRGFQGYIDDVLICGRVLGELDVAAVWNGRRSMELRGMLPLSPEAQDEKPYLNVMAQITPNGCGHNDIWQPASGIGTRIVGGFNAEANELPFQVFIRMRFGAKWYRCGGSVIDTQWVMTAAHCVTKLDNNVMIKANEVRLYFGMLLEEDLGSSESRTITNSDHINVHPDWDGGQGGPRGETDFALLYLASPLTFDPSIQAICLPQFCNDASLCSANETVLIAGYGLTTDNTGLRPGRLLKAYVKIQSDAECQQMAQASNIPHPDTVEHRLLCAWSPPHGDIDTCRGDSGGPLACYRAGFFTLQGVTSQGRSCAEPGVPAYYAEVCEVRQWITDTTSLQN